MNVKLKITADNTGDGINPDKVIQRFEREFESNETLYTWLAEQNQHPFLTIHIDMSP